VFKDMGRTTLNVMGNTVAVLLVRRFANVKDDLSVTTNPGELASCIAKSWAGLAVLRRFAKPA
jgi:hypothetical protein